MKDLRDDPRYVPFLRKLGLGAPLVR